MVKLLFGCAPQYSAQYPVTLVITSESVYLGRENFSQWPLPHIHELPPQDSLRPPFTDVQEHQINDVEKIVSCKLCRQQVACEFTARLFIFQILDRDQNAHVIVRFFKEVGQ